MSRNYFDSTFLPPLREVIRSNNLSSRNSYGQHFLLDINLIRRIVKNAGNLVGETVIEIGPGPGGLTRGLLEVAEKVIVIERDHRFSNALQQLAIKSNGRLEVIIGDATQIFLKEVISSNRTAKIVSNLPYNAGTKILIHWLRDLSRINSMTLMFQKEVAERITARSGNKSYGRLSILSQWLCHTQKLFNVPASAFVPAPKVISSLITLKPRTSKIFPAKFSALEAVTRATFGQRRKMLKSSLKTLIECPEIILHDTEIDTTMRAEQISIEKYCAIARNYAKIHSTDLN
ncbi:MAG: 16S rRNA (adenine(1518)-N(6)/adenine(1519)-N(6))-dimethyltransferase [Rhodospirillaceae bacterium]|nr:16S rRNA (adenine(1518)-N(6)/adenine(1519)-N(6))-dimethyltransferase [Rhodospirillaceae bacterium]|tara:strand:- start:8981 stop:9847 length:867 start_codon:yes stop_codon:yes gene_type:complete